MTLKNYIISRYYFIIFHLKARAKTTNAMLEY
jgi:hypothetical protein